VLYKGVEEVYGRKTLVGLNAAVFLMMLGVGMIVAILPGRILALTGDSRQVAYLASAFALSYIALQVPVGNLADRYGFRLFLAGGYLICALSGILYYLAPGASLIFGGRMLQGVGEAPVWALAPALLAISYPGNRGKVMGYYNASLHLGLTCGPLAGVALARVLSGNQVFLVYAALCLLGGLVVLLTVNDSKKVSVARKLDAGVLLPLLQNRQSAAVLAAIAFYGVGYGAYLTNIPAFLLEIKQFGSTETGVFFSLFYVAVSMAQLVTGPLSDRWGRKLFMVGGLYLSGAAFMLFARFDQLPLLSLLTAGSLGLGILCLSSMAYLSEIVPDHVKGTIAGAYYLCWGIGFFLGPIALGRLGMLPGGDRGFLALGLAAALLASLLLVAGGPDVKIYRQI
jgi:MFS family permease